MQTHSRSFYIRGVGFAVFALAAAAPWALVATLQAGKQPAPPMHRKTTDPPIPARGKLGQDLFIAVGMRNAEGIQELLKKGADPNARNGLEMVPLYIAAATHNPDAMKALIAGGAKAEAESPYGTPMTFAAISGHTEGVRILLGKGASPNPTARIDGITPLMMAAHAGNPETVAVLLANKAKVNETNNFYASALSYAARGGHVEIGRQLLAAGAKVDAADEMGETPLMIAAKTGSAEFVKLLAAKGANANAKDKKGRTALILAASYGDYPEAVKALLDAGANPKAKDAKGRTAADLASMRGYAKSAELLGKPVAAKTKDAKQAIGLSLKLLENSMSAFSRGTACISCHQEGLGRMTTAAARSRGFGFNKELNQAQLGRLRGALGFLQPLHAQALKSPEAMKQVPLIEINEVTPGDSWLLAGMAAQGDAPNAGTAAMAMVLARQQAPDGAWTFALPRIPMQSSFFTFTALSVRSLKAYGPKSEAAEISERIGKAKAWMLGAPAKTSDDLAFRLLGLKWAGASLDERKKAVEELLAAQNPDGGWSQAPGMASDAYATGQALYALRTGGEVEASNEALAKGAKYLLGTQDDDGSWFVNKRAMPANNYFDAEFPHGESQYASFNGTCWAVLGLLETALAK